MYKTLIDRLQLPRALLAPALLLAVLAPFSGAAATETLERIVAVVNNDVILASELDEEVGLARQQIRQQGQQPPPDSTLREELLDQLINERLQMQRARQFGINVGDAAIERALQQIADDNNTDLTGLREEFQRQGVDFATVRDDVRRQLIVQQLQQRAIYADVNVSEQEIEDFLERNQEEADEDTEYRVQHILLSVRGDDEDAMAAARERAEALVADLRDGDDFAALAAEYSDGPQAQDGGDLGWRSPDRLPALFLEALEPLRAGQIADPVESSNGVHILRLAERRGGVDEAITETRARHIMIRTDDGSDMDDEQARDRIVELRRRLEGGASFDNLASGHSDDPASASDGGQLGWFGPGDHSPAFHEAIDDVPTGELSEQFRTEEGWHIAEVQERRSVDDRSRYRRAQAQQILFREKVQEETQRWLRELREESYVDKRLDGASAGG